MWTLSSVWSPCVRLLWSSSMWKMHRATSYEALHIIAHQMCLCDEPHMCGSTRYRAKRARTLGKLNARFPTGKDPQPLAIASMEPKGPSSSLSSPATDLPTPQEDHVSTTKEHHSDSNSTLIRTALPDNQRFWLGSFKTDFRR